MLPPLLHMLDESEKATWNSVESVIESESSKSVKDCVLQLAYKKPRISSQAGHGSINLFEPTTVISHPLRWEKLGRPEVACQKKELIHN